MVHPSAISYPTTLPLTPLPPLQTIFIPPPSQLTPRFYEAGYAEGHAHGAQHGIFEGRQLGREKAWEVWDELGFYEGYAGVWSRRLAGATGRKEAK